MCVCISVSLTLVNELGETIIQMTYATQVKTGKYQKWSKVSSLHLYKDTKLGQTSVAAYNFWETKIPDNFLKLTAVDVQLTDCDLFSQTSKTVPSSISLHFSSTNPPPKERITHNCLACMIHKAPYTLIISFILPHHSILQSEEAPTAISQSEQRSLFYHKEFTFPYLDFYRPCLDAPTRKNLPLEVLMKPKAGQHSEKALYLLFYDFECHSESMTPCSVALTLDRYANDATMGRLQSGRDILDAVYETLITKYGSQNFVYLHLKEDEYSLCETSSEEELTKDVKKLAHTLKRLHLTPYERQWRVYWIQKDDVLFIHMPGAHTKNFCPAPPQHALSLTTLWMEILRCVGDCLVDMYPRTEDGDDYPCGANLFLYAHNNSRFDLVLFVPQLLREMCENYREWSQPMYLQNGGKIIRLDTTYCGCVNFMFRDSILMVPTNSKSLMGVAQELKLPSQKKKFDFWMLDAALSFITQHSLLAPSDHITLQECFKIHFVKKHHQLLLTGCSPLNCPTPLECTKVPHLTFDENLIPSSLNQLEASLCLYNIFDVFVLRQIVLLICKEYIAPHFLHVDTTPYSILHCGTLASTAYREMTNAALQKLNEEFNGEVKMYLAQGVYDVFMRKAIFGGRTVSTSIGNAAVAHAGKWYAQLMNEQPTLVSMHFFSLTEKWVAAFKHKGINSWDSLCEGFNTSPQQSLQWETEWESLGLLQGLVHVDISSMYPSALCSPQPVGEHYPMPIELKRKLNSDFRTIFCHTNRALRERYEGDGKSPLMYQKDLQKTIRDVYHPFKIVPFVAMVKVSYPEDLYEFAFQHCSYHSDIVFGHVPMHTRDYKQNLFTAQASQTHWAIGRDLSVILSCIDIFLLLRMGPWQVEIVEALTWSRWSKDVTHSTFERWYESKVEAEKSGDMAKRYIMKILMNSSYGGCAVNARVKKSYQLERFEEETGGVTLSTSAPVPSLTAFEMDTSVGEEEIQCMREDEEIRTQGFITTSNTCSVYKQPPLFFHPTTSTVSATQSENALPIASAYQDVNQPRIGVFRETDHKQFPLTQSGRECQNARYAPFSIFCLAYSRLCFLQMLLEPVHRRSKYIHMSHCFQDVVDFRKDPRWADVVYSDTDSLTLSLRLALYYDWKKRSIIKIGNTSSKNIMNSFALAVECCGGQKACKFWTEHGITGMPCLRISSVFGRKSYQEFCIACNAAHIRAKGQNLKDSTIQALDVRSTKMMNECALWESHKLLCSKLERAHVSNPEWEAHRQCVRSMKGLFLHKVPFRSCLLRTPEGQTSWRTHHKTACESCKKAKTRILNQENALSTSRFAMKIHLFKRDRNILQQPTLHGLEMSGDLETTNAHQKVLHPAEGYTITGDSILTRQFSPNPDADLLPCPHCQLQLPQYVHFTRRAHLLDLLLMK